MEINNKENVSNKIITNWLLRFIATPLVKMKGCDNIEEGK